MKMKKVVKNTANYRQNIMPIIFSTVTIVALNGCGGNMLSKHKTLKPTVPTSLKEKNSTINFEPVSPGMMPVSETNKK